VCYRAGTHNSGTHPRCRLSGELLPDELAKVVVDVISNAVCKAADAVLCV
jgi:hypothetical protein